MADKSIHPTSYPKLYSRFKILFYRISILYYIIHGKKTKIVKKYRYLTLPFDRPGFTRMMEDLDKDIDTVFVKDFSRLGRHNAKILLLLDQFREWDRRLIVIDDHYDSRQSEDDMIGITTWFNERSIKDTSKKIRRALNARQKEGTLITPPPFGYKRTGKNREILEIIPEEADYVRMIYTLYIQGLGYRKISRYLMQQTVPTPSMVRRKHELEKGQDTNRHIALEWSGEMVKNILDNDFYTGTLRLGKRARNTVHGKDRRIPKENHYLFTDHHPPIIDTRTYNLVQELKEKRIKSGYKGSYKTVPGNNMTDPFGSCLYCSDCGSKLTPITRKTSTGIRKYYICSTYNTKGRQFCEKAHLIEYQNLMEDITVSMQLCRDVLCDRFAEQDLQETIHPKASSAETEDTIQSEITQIKDQLHMLITQKLKDMTEHPDNKEFFVEAYDSLQQQLIRRLNALESRFREITSADPDMFSTEKKSTSITAILEDIIQNKTDRTDMEILIERIEVDQTGQTEIRLKYGLSQFITDNALKNINKQGNEILIATMKLLRERPGKTITPRTLSRKLTEMGFPQSVRSVFPCLTVMADMGMLRPPGPGETFYTIQKSTDMIEKIFRDFIQSGYIHTVCQSFTF